MSYNLTKGKIYTPEGCEINVSYHCNLSCRSCSHLSPTFKKFFVDSNQVFLDLSILAKYYHPEYIKVLGGEPLLHPELIQVIDAIRSTNITERILICTNGQLLSKTPNEFWQKITEIEISIYPGKELNSEQMKEIRQKANIYKVDLQFIYFDNFRESYSELGTKNKELVKRIYSTCQIAHIWRCHTVCNGYFYKCPQSLFLPQAINNDTLKYSQDRIKITDRPHFLNDLLAYLECSKPLTSCNHCLGSVGNLFKHEQKNRQTWRLYQQHTIEEMIDMDYLTILEKEPDSDDLCVRNHCPID